MTRACMVTSNCFTFMLFLVLIEFPSEHHAKFTVQRKSPDSTVVAKGEPLMLNVTFNGTDEATPMLVFIEWYFRRNASTSIKRVLSLTWDRGSLVSNLYHDARASAMDNTSLMLENTTLSDSGTYFCDTFSLLKSLRYPLMHFNVMVEGRPQAEITCPRNITAVVGENISCWCNARGVLMSPTALWIKSGSQISLRANRTETDRQKLSLVNVTKDTAGTYVCRAQLYSMVHEKATTIAVYYPPIISSFRGVISEHDTMTLICLADALPRPTYTIQVSDGTVLAGGSSGKVIVRNYKSLNASYICIARNNVGEDERKLHDYIPVLKATTSPKSKLKQGTEWYIIFASVVGGIVFGIVLLYGCQWLRQRKAIVTERRAQQVCEIPVYIDPATIPLPQGMKNQFADTQVYVNPVTSQSVTIQGDDVAIYVDPATLDTPREIDTTRFSANWSSSLPKSAPEYEELDAMRSNEEEHQYQSLTFERNE